MAKGWLARAFALTRRETNQSVNLTGSLNWPRPSPASFSASLLTGSSGIRNGAQCPVPSRSPLGSARPIDPLVRRCPKPAG
jgi:hypothetical protein